MQDNPFLPKRIEQLLPASQDDNKITFIVSGPRLIDALMEDKSIDDAAREAGLSTEDAIKLMATTEFQRYVEAYINIGDLADKSVRIRIAKSILAVQIASGVVSRKREPMDIIEHVRKEQMSEKGSSGVSVTLNVGHIPRPYNRIGNGQDMKQVDGSVIETKSLESKIPEIHEPENLESN